MEKTIKKVKTNIKEINKGLYEREEIIKLTYLALLSGESVFMLGAPGVAKSLIARRMKCSTQDGKYFEYLMNKFSTPEEIFGPISIKALEEDKYVRKVENYLPTSEVAFLDEIWKASPAIQNTLLTIINEKLFKNGEDVLNVPLKLLIAASNELPQSGEGLEALYDRFLIRYYVNPASTRESFEGIISSKDEEEFKPSKMQVITEEDLRLVADERRKVTISQDVFDFINLFKTRVAVELKDKQPYISDRRWKKIVGLMKTSALISGRNEVLLNDTFVIKNCAWETESQYKTINEICNEAMSEITSNKVGSSISEITKLKKYAKRCLEEGYKDTRVHGSFEHNGLKYHKYTRVGNAGLVFGLRINNDGSFVEEDSRVTVIYTDKARAEKNDFSNCSSERWYPGYFAKKRNGGWKYDGNDLNKLIVGSKKLVKAKIDEGLKAISLANLSNAKLEDKVIKLVKDMSKSDSIFDNNAKYVSQLLVAKVKDVSLKNSDELLELNAKLRNAKGE